MNPDADRMLGIGGWTYTYSGESVVDKMKRLDRERSRAAMPRRRNTRKTGR
jgi:hypothetical protein